MSHTVYVPYVIVEMSDGDHWEEVVKLYFNSYNEAMTSALALVDNLRRSHSDQFARYTACVYTFSPAK